MGRLWKYLAGRLAAPRAGLAPAFVVASHSWQALSRSASDGTEGSIWRTVMLWWGVALYLLAVVTISVAAAIGTWHLLTPEQRQKYRARMETIRKVRITRR